MSASRSYENLEKKQLISENESKDSYQSTHQKNNMPGLTFFRGIPNRVRSHMISYLQQEDMSSFMSVSRDIWAGRAKHYEIEIKSKNTNTCRDISAALLCLLFPPLLCFKKTLCSCATRCSDSCCNTIQSYQGDPIFFVPLDEVSLSHDEIKHSKPLHISRNFTTSQITNNIKSLGIKRYCRVSLANDLSDEAIITLIKSLPKDSELILPTSPSESALKLLANARPHFTYKMIIPLGISSDVLIAFANAMPSFYQRNLIFSSKSQEDLVNITLVNKFFPRSTEPKVHLSRYMA